MSISVAILGLAVLILIHEAGHFVAARAVGMRPRKFYLGFGPPLIKTVRGGVEYGIAAFPLGGYVKIPGMHRPAPGDLRSTLRPEQQEQLREPLDALDAALERGDEDGARAQLPRLEPVLAKNRMFEELDGALAPDAYWRQPAWKRVVVIGAGPFTNIVCAIVLFTAVFMVGGSKATRTVDSVLAGHPAVAAGLSSGDEVISIAGHPVTPSTISDAINATKGRPFKLVVERAGKRVVLGPIRARDNGGRYQVGFALRVVPAAGESLPRAVGSAFHLAGDETSLQFRGIAGLFHGSGTHQVSSVVGIVRVTSDAFRQSLSEFFYFIGFISLALALINLLPVLPLDGGHIVISLLERMRGRAFSQLVYMRYSAIGIGLFLFLLYFGLRNDLGGGS